MTDINRGNDGSKSPSSPQTQKRLDLLAAGFAPIPARGKSTNLVGWTQKNITVDEITSWKTAHADHSSTGVRTKTTPTLDVDVLNAEAADAVEALVRERFTPHGKVLVRIGQAPKRAIPFKTDAPFKKISVVFSKRDGADKEEKIEFLADGQMFVAYGIHPDTRQPYTWRGGEPGEVKRDELPQVVRDEAQQLVEDAAKLLVERFGYAVSGGDSVSLKDAVKHQKEWQGLIDKVLTGENYHDPLRDLAAKLIAVGMHPNAAVDLMQSWMKSSTGPQDKRWKDRYDYIPRAVATAQKKFSKVTLEDFRAYMPDHNYVFMPTREHWPASSVNSRISPVKVTDDDGNPVLDRHGNQLKMKPSAWLDVHRPVEQMAWVPGEDAIIRGRLVSAGGWFVKPGASCLNLYRPPTIELGDKNKAGPWVSLVHKLYPDDADHIIDYFAHRRQKPHEKINHAIILGGDYGIGKDTLVEALKQAVGPWNFSEISPHNVFEPFNPYMKATVIRVSEARDQGDQGRFDRFQFYERMKGITVTPPDVVSVNEKHIRQYYVFNRAGIVITANRKDSFYIPANDRRYYVAWSTLKKGYAAREFWADFYRWYEAGGYGHVAAYLTERDISKFNPKAEPSKTATFQEIVMINRAPEDAELTDALEHLGYPDAATIMEIADAALRIGNRELFHELKDRSRARTIPHRMGRGGYVSMDNPAAPSDGRWVVGSKKHVVYVKEELSLRQRHEAADALVQWAKIDIAMAEAVREDRLRANPHADVAGLPSSIWA
jgi:hypothetical protein